MKYLLDKELPERKRRYGLPLWFAVLLLCTAFVSGFYMSESRRALSPESFTSISHSNELSLTNQADRKMTYPELLPENQNNDSKQKSSGTFRGRKVSGKLSKTNVTGTFINLPALHASKREPITTLPANSSVQGTTNPEPAQAAADMREKIHLTSVNSFVSPCKTNFKPTPSLQLTEVAAFNMNHQLSIATGSGFKSAHILSGSIAYNLLFTKNNILWHGGIGYRYIHMDYQNNISRSSVKETGNATANDLQIWSLTGLHQLFTDIGFRREWRNSWFAGAGLTIPVNLAYTPSSADKDFGILESNSTTVNGNNFFNGSYAKAESVRKWDIQPYISIGKNISSKIRIFSVIRAGLAPLNTLPLEKGKDVRLHEISLGVHYVL